jgi:hypothetical protein
MVDGSLKPVPTESTPRVCTSRVPAIAPISAEQNLSLSIGLNREKIQLTCVALDDVHVNGGAELCENRWVLVSSAHDFSDRQRSIKAHRPPYFS